MRHQMYLTKASESMLYNTLGWSCLCCFGDSPPPPRARPAATIALTTTLLAPPPGLLRELSEIDDERVIDVCEQYPSCVAFDLVGTNVSDNLMFAAIRGNKNFRSKLLKLNLRCTNVADAGTFINPRIRLYCTTGIAQLPPS